MGCLLIHGFTGSPVEVRPLGEHLAERGFRVVGVQLPGHGTDVGALDDVDWMDWLAAVEDGRRWLEESCSTVVVCGLSMGGLLGVVHAARNPPDALILLAPGFEIANPLFPLVKWLGWLPAALPAPAQSGLTAADGWKRLWHYERRPIRAARELMRVQGVARDALSSVTVPTLVVQGRRDVTLHPAGAQTAYDRLGSARKKIVWLENSGHIATADVEADALFGAVDAFLADLTSVGRT